MKQNLEIRNRNIDAAISMNTIIVNELHIGYHNQISQTYVVTRF